MTPIDAYDRAALGRGAEMSAVAVAMGLALFEAVASAQPAGPSQEIVVTGERIPLRLRETPSSVAAISQRDIEASGAHKMDQLLAAIPNVQLGNGSQGPAIRGLDTTGPLFALPAFLGGNRPRTTVVVDGRPVTYNEFVFGVFPLWDLERVEIFRSPQTTTQGTNSIAGAIFLTTSDPGKEHEGRARSIVGSLDALQGSVMVSGPLSGHIGLRLSGDWRTSSTSSRILDEIRGADPNDDDQSLIRAKLLLTPDEATRAELTYVHSRAQSPQQVGVTAPFEERTDVGGYGVFRIRVDSLTSVMTHQLTPSLKIAATLSAGTSEARRFAIPNFGEARNAGRDWSGELIVDWTASGSVRVIGGMAHQQLRLRQHINLSALSGAVGRFRDRQDGAGLFADVRVDLAPGLRATAGLRYQRDRQRRAGALAATSFDVPIDYLGVFEAWLPKLTVSYDLNAEITAGAMVQKAANPGGTTVRVDTLQPDEFDAERLWDYEAFVRASFAGGRGSISFNAFRYDIRNAQRSRSIFLQTPSGRRVGFASLFNVERARSQGVEAQIEWQGQRITVRGAVGLLRTRTPRGNGEAAYLQGREFERSPHFSGSAAFDWQATDKLRLSAQVRHHSSYYSLGPAAVQLRVPSGTTVDARAEYQFGRLRLFGQVRNAFDRFNLLDLDDVDSGEAEDPRLFAIGLETLF